MYGLRWSSVDLSIHFTVADFWRQLDKKYGLYSGVWWTIDKKRVLCLENVLYSTGHRADFSKRFPEIFEWYGVKVFLLRFFCEWISFAKFFFEMLVLQKKIVYIFSREIFSLKKKNKTKGGDLLWQPRKRRRRPPRRRQRKRKRSSSSCFDPNR